MYSPAHGEGRQKVLAKLSKTLFNAHYKQAHANMGSKFILIQSNSIYIHRDSIKHV